MNICIFGAGAIGCWLGAKLKRAGQEPTLIARGAHLQALKTKGLHITEAGEDEILPVRACDANDELPQFDTVIVTLKAHSMSSAVPSLTRLLNNESSVLFAVNGVPWWFNYGLKVSKFQETISSVDPHGDIWSEIGPERALGCVLYPAAELVEPGKVVHISGTRISLGEPIGGSSKRVEDLASLLNDAGCRASVRRDIRNEIWIKLWGNVAFNPMSVLTGATLDRMATEPGTRAIAYQLMQETQRIGEVFGARFGMTIEKRLDGAASVGAHKTSMLQDYLNGKPLETAAMLDAVLELAERASVEAPTIRMVQRLLNMKLASEGRLGEING